MSYAILVTPTRSLYPTQLILPHVVTLLIFSEEYGSRRLTLVFSILLLQSTLNV